MFQFEAYLYIIKLNSNNSTCLELRLRNFFFFEDRSFISNIVENGSAHSNNKKTNMSSLSCLYFLFFKGQKWYGPNRSRKY